MQNVDNLRDEQIVKKMAHTLKTFHSVCRAVGAPFFTQVNLALCLKNMFFQLTRIYMDMLKVYKVTSENISSVVQRGEHVEHPALIRSMRGLKTDSLLLISTWVDQSALEHRQLVGVRFSRLLGNENSSCIIYITDIVEFGFDVFSGETSPQFAACRSSSRSCRRCSTRCSSTISATSRARVSRRCCR